MLKISSLAFLVGVSCSHASLGAIVAAEPNLPLEGNGTDIAIIHEIARAADGGYAVVGQFSMGKCRNYLRLRSDFTLKDCASIAGPVFTVVSLADGSDVIGGRFLLANGAARLNLARIVDGAIDLSWSGGVLNGDVYALAKGDNGSVFAGGTFDLATSAAATVPAVGGIAKFSSGSGEPSETFAPVVGAGSWALHYSSGLLFFGGFGSIDSAQFGYVDSTTGTLQGSISVGCSSGNCYNPAVLKIDSDSSGRVYFSGIFDLVDGQQRAGMVRLTDDLVLDQDWTPFSWQSSRTENLDFSFDDRDHVYTAMLGCRSLLPDGFTCGMARISTSTGVADTSMNVATNAYAIVATGGGVLVGGEFGVMQDDARSSLARILPTVIFSLGGFEAE